MGCETSADDEIALKLQEKDGCNVKNIFKS